MGPEDLNEANPRLIYVRISGFGQTGPYRDRTSYDRIGQAIGGLIYVTGEPDQPPVHPGYMMGDYASGTFGALAILAATDADQGHEIRKHWRPIISKPPPRR